MYNVSHAFSGSSGGVTVASCAIGSRPFTGASITPIMPSDGGGAIEMSSMAIQVTRRNECNVNVCLVLLIPFQKGTLRHLSDHWSEQVQTAEMDKNVTIWPWSIVCYCSRHLNGSFTKLLVRPKVVLNRITQMFRLAATGASHE